MKCKNCGAEIPHGTDQCLYCGSEAEKPASDVPFFVRHKTLCLVLGILFGLFTVLFLVSRWFLNTDKFRMKKNTRWVIVVIVWIVFLLYALSFGTGMKRTVSPVNNYGYELPEEYQKTLKELISQPGVMYGTEVPPVSGTPSDETVSGEDVSAENLEGISPGFKALMDEYEEFFDGFAAFMTGSQPQQDPTAYSTEYISYMYRINEMDQRMESIDQDSLSEEERAYFKETTERINKKISRFGISLSY